MLSKKVQDAFNKHMNMEMYSSYLYLSMSAYFDSISLEGMAQWMRIQAQEEMLHAMKFFDFILERDGNVELAAINKPKKSWKSTLDAFQEAYNHECKISGLINDLVDMSLKEKDHAANAFLQWFVTEQVEEEATVLTIVDKLKFIEKDKVALFMMNEDLGSRVFTPPADSAQ
ncbi:ferritin [candidate division KSB1 bacterium]